MHLGSKHNILALVVLTLDITIAENNLCDNYTDVLSHINEVDVQIQCQPGEPDTFVKFHFQSDAGPYSNTTQIGWCLDMEQGFLCDDFYYVDTMSSYDPIILGREQDYVVDRPENLDLINWFINTHPIGSSFYVPDCDPETGKYTDGLTAIGNLEHPEYQTAMWHFIDDRATNRTDVFPTSFNATNPFATSKKCIVDWLVNTTYDNPNASRFVPDCGHKIGVLVFLDENDVSHVDTTFQEITRQVMMAEIQLSSIDDVCNCNPDGNVHGDPHFQTWSGEMYDFHGVCDLTLLQNHKFMKGLGMTIHVRSKRMKAHFSYISSAAIRIGSDTFEVAGHKDGDTYWLNGKQGPSGGALEEMAIIAGYPITFHQVHSNQRGYTIQISEGEMIDFVAWNDFVRVDVKGASKSNYRDSLGLLGSFNQMGAKLGRDGITAFDDINRFGQEWQVLASESAIFHEVDGPQHPALCKIPNQMALRRRLVESSITMTDAELACSHVKAKYRDMCAFDVMATNDKSVVDAY